ncbi:MAG: hypothetical protein M5R36_29480 [Deltaproteobacteria bacterium]|nr:hypothetical protein [Deltaproteobacteria bacterium]
MMDKYVPFFSTNRRQDAEGSLSSAPAPTRNSGYVPIKPSAPDSSNPYVPLNPSSGAISSAGYTPVPVQKKIPGEPEYVPMVNVASESNDIRMSANDLPRVEAIPEVFFPPVGQIPLIPIAKAKKKFSNRYRRKVPVASILHITPRQGLRIRNFFLAFTRSTIEVIFLYLAFILHIHRPLIAKATYYSETIRLMLL